MIEDSSGEKVMQFTCDHCDISLTVDRSLAGVTGPCPSCGKSVKAPSLETKESPESQPNRVSADSVSQKEERSRSVDRVSPKTGPLSDDVDHPRLRGNRAGRSGIFKILGIGLVVLIIVLVVTFLLK